jgi:hypothetical protein
MEPQQGTFRPDPVLLPGTRAGVRRGVSAETGRDGGRLAELSARVGDAPLDWPVFDGDGTPAASDVVSAAVVAGVEGRLGEAGPRSAPR